MIIADIDLHTYYMIAGLILIVIEVLVLQMTLGWLLVAGFAMLSTALVLFLFPALGFKASLLAFSLISLVLGVLFHRFFRQQIRGRKQASGLAGETTDATDTAVVIDDISPTQDGKVRWSGAEWRARMAEDCQADSLAKGEKVYIRNNKSIILIVSSHP